MRDRFQNFMDGRYGSDQLNRFLSLAALVLIIINLFVSVSILWIAALVLLVWSYFRMFSRNTSQRAVENDRFLDFTSRFRRNGGYGGYGRNGGYGGQNGYGGNGGCGRNSGYGGNGGYGGNSGYGGRGSCGYGGRARQSAEARRAQREQKKYYRFFMCPRCSQKVRVPKGKGRIEITCPKCRTSFIRKT
ncbi:MAG: zinc-ribbon domain-containing protein [Lachnospiraceae bacterium]|nr:zinc-ribbon domain-containing protein [Lachnospiraceae bacterium]